jgi:hypothetical protein
MKNSKDILIEIEKIAPNLSDIEKKNEFDTPVDYFDNLSFNIQNRIAKQSSKNQKSISVWYQKPHFAIAASIIVIFVIAFFYINNFRQKQFAEKEVIYWDEILNDITIIDKVDEYQLVDAYIEQTTIEQDVSKNTSEIFTEAEEIENELADDIFTDI